MPSSVGAKPADKVFQRHRHASINTFDSLKLLASGGFAGAVAKTCVAPLERTKLLMQVQGMRSKRLQNVKSAAPGQRSMFVTMNWILKTQGFKAFWRGNAANVIRIIPNKAVLFFCNDYYKSIYRERVSTVEKIPKAHKFFIGAASGATVAISTYPLDFVRTRISTQEGKTAQYKGMLDCAQKTVQIEGVKGLYRGLFPTLMGIMPYAGLTLMCYETFKQFAPKKKSGETSIIYKLMSAGSAGCIAQTTVFPIDTVRRRMVLQGEHGAKELYKNSFDCVRSILKKEGVAGFYHGAFANIIRAIPNTAIQWTVLEETKKFFKI